MVDKLELSPATIGIGSGDVESEDVIFICTGLGNLIVQGCQSQSGTGEFRDDSRVRDSGLVDLVELDLVAHIGGLGHPVLVLGDVLVTIYIQDESIRQLTDDLLLK
jgi:hypothetical protein